MSDPRRDLCNETLAGGDTIFEMPVVERSPRAPSKVARQSIPAAAALKVELGIEPLYRVGRWRQHVYVRLTKLEPGPVGVDVHVEIGGVDQLIQARSVNLDRSVCELEFPFFSPSNGVKPIERIEVAVVGSDGHLEVLEIGAGRAGVIEVTNDGSGAASPVTRPSRITWQSLTLEPAVQPDVDHLVKNVIATAGTLAVPKRVVMDLPNVSPRLLRLQARGGERRLFVLLGDTSVSLGRQLPSAMDGSDESHIALRVLPCRTQQLDPLTWSQTMQISRVHAELRLVGDGVELRVSGRHGVLLDKRELGPNERATLPESFWMRFGRGLALRGRVFRPGYDSYMLQIAAGRPLPPPQLLDAAVRGSVDCVHLTRVLNQTADEYVVLYRSAALGSSRSCPLRFAGAGVTPLHARLLRHRGLLFVTAARGSNGRVEVDGRRLRPDEAAPLQPRSTLRLGDTVIDVDIVSHAAMVE